MLKGNEIRNLYLNYFKEKHQHTIVESSSLVPDNPTVLLTTAGMLQFLPIFLGIQKSPYDPARATSCQKCARAGGKDSDIENVGRTPRHHTFFEMLGNFSFGDYYKKEVIPWAWEFVTEVLKLDKDRLWITIYETDDEAYDIWRSIGVPDERIKRKGKKDNFWGPPGASGSCGPCSEIHYDLGEEYKCDDPNCGIDTCECDRWVEIWNLVFTELYQDEEGNQSPLEHKNVDTGMGLERITMVCQGVASTFETDLLKPILDKVSEMSGVPYKKSEKTDVSLRIITDHARCVSFLISDGVIPGNEGRSYVLRMILRRALRHGKILGMDLPFLYKLVDTVVDMYGEAYPDLVKNKAKIIDVIKKEEERFAKTLDRGYKLLDEFIANKKDIDGESAFKLYDTYGFPFELTREIAEENGLKADEAGYKVAMQEQKDRAKAATAKISVTGDMKYAKVEDEVGSTDFVGYTETECDAKVLALIEGEGFVDVVLDKTPFYAERGGQVADHGNIYSQDGELVAKVIDVQHAPNDQNLHFVDLILPVEKGKEYILKLDKERREGLRHSHSATHLLHAALRQVLGEHTHQAGSLVDPDYLRFDFTALEPMTPREIKTVEELVNQKIWEAIQVKTTITTPEEGEKMGALALFNGKYGDKVRVVQMGDFSSEFCGGTHVDNTNQIGIFKITSESAVGAGMRRIEAVTSKKAYKYLAERSSLLDDIQEDVKATKPDNIIDKIDSLESDLHDSQKQVEALTKKINQAKAGQIFDNVKQAGDLTVISAIADVNNMNDLRELADNWKSGNKSDVLVLAANNDGKANMIISLDQKALDKGLKAGDLIKIAAPIFGGGGGGRPNMAQAGGKKPEGLNDAIKAVIDEISKN